MGAREGNPHPPYVEFLKHTAPGLRRATYMGLPGIRNRESPRFQLPRLPSTALYQTFTLQMATGAPLEILWHLRLRIHLSSSSSCRRVEEKRCGPRRCRVLCAFGAPALFAF